MELIECPNCQISFTAKLLHCPRCKTYETPREKHWEFLAKDAVNQLHDGVSAEELRTTLRSAGMPESKVEQIVGHSASIVGWEGRRIGFTRILIGSWMIVFALVVGLLMLWILQSIGVLGANGRIIVLIVAGILVFGGGIWLLLIGVWSAVTGKE